MTEKEYNECVTLYADNVYRFILKNLRREDDARDVVQSAFEKLWKNRGSVDAVKSKSYLFTIAYHQMIDQLRKEKRVELKSVFREETIVSERPVSQLKKTLETALARLNETQRS